MSGATHTAEAPPGGDERLVPLKVVSSMVGLQRTAIYGRVSAKTFPEPVRLSARCSRWKLSAVRSWIAAQTEQVPT